MRLVAYLIIYTIRVNLFPCIDQDLVAHLGAAEFVVIFILTTACPAGMSVGL